VAKPFPMLRNRRMGSRRSACFEFLRWARASTTQTPTTPEELQRLAASADYAVEMRGTLSVAEALAATLRCARHHAHEECLQFQRSPPIDYSSVI